MGTFNFVNLSGSVRQKMLTEIEADLAAGKLYISPRLNERGRESYPRYLKASVAEGDESTLEVLLQQNDCLNKTESRGGTMRRVIRNAARLIAQNEFNRFYIRAVCLEAIERGIDEVEVYRARESTETRPESDALVGSKVNARELLDDLRESVGTAPALLPEVNSGLSVKVDGLSML